MVSDHSPYEKWLAIIGKINPIIYLLNPMENPIQPPFSYGFPMVFQWFSNGFPMV